MNDIEANLAKDSAAKLAITSTDTLPTSTMPTPMLYISRSSSMTSLNSFDIKSVHSSIASEYSQVTSPLSAPIHNTGTKIKKTSGEYDEEVNCYSVDDDLDLIMPESPSAQHESSFLMTQRVKHKQQQIIYRQTAAAAMNPASGQANDSILSNNLFVNDQKATSYIQQMNKFMSSAGNLKTVAINNNTEVSAVENSKPWKQCLTQQTSTIQANKLTDLNQLMTRLNITNTNNSSLILSNNCPVTKDTLSFLNTVTTTTSTTLKSNTNNNNSNNNNNIHTPPVKLVQAPKFISNFQQQQFTASLAQPPPIISNSQLSSASAVTAPMSVTYAFMKKSNPPPQTLPLQQSAQPPPTQPIITSYPTNPCQFTPKFLLSTQSYQSYNPPTSNTVQTTVPVQALVSSSSSSSCSSSSQASVINQQQQQQQLSPTPSNHESVISEAPCIYSVESRLNYNRTADAANNTENNKSCPLSPQESICSRMSDSSVPSLIRQDITSRSNQFQAYFSNQQHSNGTDFRALFSRLNSSDAKQNLNPQSQQQQQYQNQNQLNLNPNSNSEYVEEDEKPKVFLNFDEDSNTPQFLAKHIKLTNQFLPQQARSFHGAPNGSPFQQQYLYQSVNDSNLDQTYSPKVFQNEGTNSRYSSASSLNQDDDEENDNTQVYHSQHHHHHDHLLKQNNTPAVCLASMTNLTDNYDCINNESTNNDQEDDLMLENFIKEMLPAIKPEQNSKKTQMQSSESSMSLTSSVCKSQIAKQKSIDFKSGKNQISKSSSFKENKQIFQTSMVIKTSTASSVKKSTSNKRLSAENSSSLSKPKAVLSKNFNQQAIQPNPQQCLAKTALKIENAKSFSTAPVVNMTKTAQLRAFNNKKLSSSNATASNTISSKGSANLTKSTAIVPKSVKIRDNLLSKQQPSQDNTDLNSSSHLVHSIAENTNTRRQSFSFGCNKTTQNTTKLATKTDVNSSRVVQSNRLNTKLNK